MHLCRSSSKAPRVPTFLKLLQNPHVLLTSGRVQKSFAPAPQNDASTFKSGPNMVCFVHFDFETCFAPQWRALFRLLNLQKCSDLGVLCKFLLWHVLRATTACNFWTSQLPKVLRAWGVWPFWLLLRATMARNFSCLIWPDGPASAALASLLFKLPEPQNIEKTQCFVTFFWFFLFSDLLLLFSSFLFSSLILPTSAFPFVHIVGSLTSKLPAIIYF